jgi:flavin reductase (DIM6/NTAB) family NADH-FMN oxidoreductase RutF
MMARADSVDILSYFWAPLVAVGASYGGRVNAHISLSVLGASIVPQRPRLLCVIYKHNYTHQMVMRSGRFSVSLLAHDQLHLVPALGFVSGRQEDKMRNLEFFLTEAGDPVMAGCLGWAQCRVMDALDLGDATCFLAAVTARARLREGEPLWWFRVRPTLPPEWLARWEAKLARNIEASVRLMRWPFQAEGP